MKKTESPAPTKLHRATAMVLTVLFLFTIFGAFALTTLPNLSGILDSLKYHRADDFFKTENPDFFDVTAARFASLDNYLSSKLPLEDELGYINADFQYAIGKNMIVNGSAEILRMKDNLFYEMSTATSLEDAAQELADFISRFKDDIPCFFTLISPKFYPGSDVQLPEGYAELDTGNELSEQVLSIVGKTGIPVFDSREFLANSPFPYDEMFLYTDMHWTTLAGLLVAQQYAAEINRLTGANLDVSRLDLSQFDVEEYPHIFASTTGHQIGLNNTGLDTIRLYVPKYETSFARETITSSGETEHATGSFRDAVLKTEKLVQDKAHSVYGLVEGFEKMTNLGDCEDMTILIYRDSYTAPVGCFLSLLAKNTVMVDMRKADRPAYEYIEEYDPDIVIVSLSRQMMVSHGYSLED